jgi:hypothetical protein
VIGEADARLRSGTTAQGLRLRTLPKPEQLVNADVEDVLFHRLSVAYGLSFDSPNIGGISSPGETPDLPPPPRRRIDDDYISKDQV